MGSAGDRRSSARRGPEKNLDSHPAVGRTIAQSRSGPMQPGWRSLGTPGLQSPGSGSPPDTSFNSWGSSARSPRALSVGDRDMSWVGRVLGCFIAFPSIDVDVNAPPRRSRTVRRVDTCQRQNRMYRVANACNADGRWLIGALRGRRHGRQRARDGRWADGGVVSSRARSGCIRRSTPALWFRRARSAPARPLEGARQARPGGRGRLPGRSHVWPTQSSRAGAR